MSYMISLVCVLVITTKHSSGEDIKYGPIIETSDGPIRGYSFTSLWTNQLIYAFSGIPYAAPPIGNLRFKDPVSVEKKWTSVRDCTADGDSCMQDADLILQQKNLTYTMSEDCLFLNVYSPQLKPDKALPVMVWVHGGAFLKGSGSYFRYGPDFIVAQGVIVVTFNYRLGPFGFLNLGTSEIPGNAGMKDQVFALRWVQREIRKFGGDPGLVTVFGESAGSASVHLHYLSPLSKGLFQRVIGQSGASLFWAVIEDGPKYGLQYASALNCSTHDLSEADKCLRATSADDILKGKILVKRAEGDYVDSLGLVFVPTVDKNSSSHPFLPEMPKYLIKNKQGSKVPFLMGIVRDEGMLLMLFRDETYILNITKNLEQFIPKDVRARSSKSRKKYFVDKIKSFYYKNDNNRDGIIRDFVKHQTDSFFGYDTAVSAKLYRERNPVYLYTFNFNGNFKEPYSEMLEKKYNFRGVAHAEDQSYLFVRAKVNQSASENSREMVTWRRLVKMWTNFAKFGTPTVEPDPLLENITWLPVGKVSTRYLDIDDNITMEAGDFLGPAVTLWDSIYSTSDYTSFQVASAVVLVTAAIYAAM